MKLKKRTIAIELAPEGENFLHELAFTVSLRDEGAGEFFVIEQVGGKLDVEVHEWQALVAVVDELIGTIKVDEPKPKPKTRNHTHSFDGALMHGGDE